MEVIYYRAETGNCPMLDFLNSLPVNMRAAVARDITLLEERGNKIAMPFSKPMGDGLYELRTKGDSSIARTFYFFYVKDTIIVTHGFIKKAQKTPPAEIEKAWKYKKDHERRNKR